MKITAHSTYNKIRLFLLLGSWIQGVGFSQNLVTNSTFEAKSLKNAYGEITKAHGWENANGGSADLFNKTNIGKITINGIPDNYMGHQSSSDGQNYIGILAYYDDGIYCDTSARKKENNFTLDKLGIDEGYKRYTEYLEGQLREPMIAGSLYTISFRINLADNSARAVSCFGALLTSREVKQDNNAFLALTPQFISHQVITDSINWVILTGAYTAVGGERYITIGCFKDADFMVQKIVSASQNDSRKAYYYVSEISVIPDASVKTKAEDLEVKK